MIKTLCLSFFIIPCALYGQYNYVPNPSFEEFISCPDGYSQLDRCYNWRAATSGTADYLKDCGFPSSVGTPSNNIGFQEPRTGLAYAGIIAYSQNSFADYKEYIEVKLKNPLIEGYDYIVTYYVSLAENVSTYAVKNLGFVLSPLDVGIDYLYGTIDNVPMTDPSDDYYSNTSEWVKLEFNYKALGNEEFLTIGNFDKTIFTDAQYINPSGEGFAYYFVDDVSVVIDYESSVFDGNYGNGYDTAAISPNAYYLDGALMDAIIPNVITVDNDLINGEFFIKYWGYLKAEVIIVDRWGGVVLNSDTFISESWAPENKADGVYFYTIKLLRPDGEWDDFQGNIQVI